MLTESYSADTFQGGEARGALSWAFMKTFQQQGRNQSYLQLLNNIRSILEADYLQKPQLSSSHPLGKSELFINLTTRNERGF